MAGPLAGVRVLELAGIGPGTHAAMLLADLGADVLRVERPAGGLRLLPAEKDHLLRGRRSVAADLKDPDQRDTVLRLVDRADVLIEGYRPGTTERLGVGPDACLARNPRLVYARMTGWGQDGPLADRAGHDINYLSLTGALHAIRAGDGKPVPPLNLLGDFGGGSLYLVTGVLAALLERNRSGRGQVLDVSIVDGVSSLLQMIWALRGQGGWQDEPGTNLLDSGAPFYDTYRCADGGWVAVGALEPAFYAQLLAGLALEPAELPAQHDRGRWPELRSRLAERFATRTQSAWEKIFAGTDACVTPVLSFTEAAEHPHLIARGTLPERHGVVQAAAAPRFSRSVPDPARPPATPGADTAGWLD
jgi:alpha-methylacyl-CoA racemase